MKVAQYGAKRHKRVMYTWTALPGGGAVRHRDMFQDILWHFMKSMYRKAWKMFARQS